MRNNSGDHARIVAHNIVIDNIMRDNSAHHARIVTHNKVIDHSMWDNSGQTEKKNVVQIDSQW